MGRNSAAALMVVEGALIVQLSANLTDEAVRDLRDAVNETLVARSLLGLVLDMSDVDMMDSFITRCIRDVAIGARLTGVPTIVCGIQPAVADTLVEMGIELGGVKTALSLDAALRSLRRSSGPFRPSNAR